MKHPYLLIKGRQNLRRRVWAGVAILLALAGCNRSSEWHYAEPESRVSIAWLRSLATEKCVAIREPLTIEGQVTANDLFGEFDRTLILQDSTGGIELRIDHRDLYIRYPLGARVRVSCEGLSLGDYGGKVLLGAAPTGSFVVDDIPAAELDRFLTLLEPGQTMVAPQPLTVATADRRWAGCYVEFRQMRPIREEKGLSWCDTDPLTLLPTTTIRHFVDPRNDTLQLYTAASCHYATEPLPEGEGTLRGILDWFNHKIQLRIANHDFLFE